jgi:hypothetical protein
VKKLKSKKAKEKKKSKKSKKEIKKKEAENFSKKFGFSHLSLGPP